MTRRKMRPGIGLVVAIVGVVTVGGCSSDDPSESSPSAGASKSRASAGGSEAHAAASVPAQPAPAKASGAGPSASPGSAPGIRIESVLPPGAAEPDSVELVNAGSGVAKRFSKASASVKGLSRGVTYRTATVGGEAVADVAIYSFDSDLAGGDVFRDQIVRQLVSLAAPSKTVKYDQVLDRQIAVAIAKSTAAGWFGDKGAVVVLGDPGKASLNRVSAVVRGFPQG